MKIEKIKTGKYYQTILSHKIKGVILTECGISSGIYSNCVETFSFLIQHLASHNNYKHFLDNNNLFFINATPKTICLIDELKSLGKKVIIILECSNAFRNNNYLSFYNHLIKADLILTQFGYPYIDILKSYIKDIPIEFFGVPVDLERIKDVVKNIEKKFRTIHIHTLDGSSEFNIQTNFTICKKLQNINPNYRIITPYINPVFLSNLKNITVTGYLGQQDYWKSIASCRVSLNMGSKITWGRYFIESAAVYTPIVSSYCGAADLSEIQTFNEFDIDHTVKEIIKIIEDENYYIFVANNNKKKIEILNPYNRYNDLIKNLNKNGIKFETILNENYKKEFC